ncbi:MAG TPA: hypothetical protein VGM56_02120 [Byssovorax sp.]
MGAVVSAGVGFDVAAHLLAHVPVPASAPRLARAASLWDARYVAWARATLPEATIGPIVRDAALLGALVGRGPGGHRLQAMLGLHDDAEGWARAARVDVGELARGWAADALVALADDARELVEVARADAGLVAWSYARARDGAIAREIDEATAAVAGRLSELLEAVPAIAGARVMLSHPLGRCGRALPDAIVVGAPAAWNGLDADEAAVRVAHEVAVHLATGALGAEGDETRWLGVEAAALDAVALRLAGTPFSRAHAAFTSGLAPLGPPIPGHAARVRDLITRLEG